MGIIIIITNMQQYFKVPLYSYLGFYGKFSGRQIYIFLFLQTLFQIVNWNFLC